MTPDETARGVSCIIPAFNEGPRIAAVLAVVTSHPLIAEVIVVDDGSTDDTAAIAENFATVQLIRMDQNGGKSRSLAAGFARAREPHVLLVDSDLEGLRAEDLTSLIQPVLDGRADMTISLRGNAPSLWRWIGVDYISGERMFRRSLIEDRLRDLGQLPRFGCEIWINRVCLSAAARIAVVGWPNVASPTKNRKRGFAAGINADLRMMADLFRSASAFEILRQIWAMRKSSVASAKGKFG